MRTISHYINGQIYSGTSGRQGDVFNPATGEVSTKVDFATPEIVDEAVGAARVAGEA